MDKVVKAATPEQIAEAERRSKEQQEAAAKQPPAPPRFVDDKAKNASKVIPLEYPIEYDGKVYESLTLRRLRGKDFKRLARMEGDEEIALASLLTGAPKEVIEALDGEDFIELQGAVENFLPRKLRDMAAQLSENGQPTLQ